VLSKLLTLQLKNLGIPFRGYLRRIAADSVNRITYCLYPGTCHWQPGSQSASCGRNIADK